MGGGEKNDTIGDTSRAANPYNCARGIKKKGGCRGYGVKKDLKWAERAKTASPRGHQLGRAGTRGEKRRGELHLKKAKGRWFAAGDHRKFERDGGKGKCIKLKLTC